MPESIIKISTGFENGGSNRQILYPPKFVFVYKDKKKSHQNLTSTQKGQRPQHMSENYRSSRRKYPRKLCNLAKISYI